MRISLKCLKNDDFNISNKERSGRPATIKKKLTNYWKMKENRGKRWKILGLIHIVLIFLIVI